MILGSHNSWSFLTPERWWMRLIAFTARCQRANFYEQCLHDVRCFDLRIRFDDDGVWHIVHGPIVYKLYKGVYEYDIFHNLSHLNDMGAYVRVILDIRSKRKYTSIQREWFIDFCKEMELMYPNIKFWCGRCLADWGNVVYPFADTPSCEERYGSVTKPKWLWGIWPRLYAKRHNKEIRERGTDKDILLIDFVDIK